MKIVSLKNAIVIDIQKEYVKLQNQIKQAKLNGKGTIYLEELHTELHLKLIMDDYIVKKIKKNNSFFPFIRKRKKYYVIDFKPI